VTFSMPIQDHELPGPFVWEPTAADRSQAISNHDQTLERLAQRGGMSWCEMAAIVLNKRWQRMEQPYAKAVCRDVLLNRKAFGVNVRPASAKALGSAEPPDDRRDITDAELGPGNTSILPPGEAEGLGSAVAESGYDGPRAASDGPRQSEGGEP
jgi:hypothetical protein